MDQNMEQPGPTKAAQMRRVLKESPDSWLNILRKLLGGKHDDFCRSLAELLGCKSKDPARKAERFYQELETEKTAREIVAALPGIKARLNDPGFMTKLSLDAETCARLRREVLPNMEHDCRLLAGHRPDISYRLGTSNWDKTSALKSRWKDISRLALVHINGGIFRRQRLQWQVDECHRKLSPGFFCPDTPLGEGQVQTITNIEEELDGEEPWECLNKLSVFIASEEMYQRWTKASCYGIFESPEMTRYFWKGYLTQLQRQADHQIREGKRVHGPDLALYEVHHLDFLAYFINCGGAGGCIIGTHLICAKPAPKIFELSWPLGMDAPPDFSEVHSAVERIRETANQLF